MIPQSAIAVTAGVSCCLFHAVFDAKKKAVPKGRIPGRGIVLWFNRVKIDRFGSLRKYNSRINGLKMRYYFTAFVKA